MYEGVSRHIDQSALVINAIAAILASTLLFWIITYLPIRRILCSPDTQSVALKRGLIAGQIFIGSLFFITSIILFMQLHFILNKDKGVEYENVLQMDMGYENAYENDLRSSRTGVAKPSLYTRSLLHSSKLSRYLRNKGDWYGTEVTHLSFDPAETDPFREDNLMLVSKDFFSLFHIGLKRRKMAGRK